MTTLHAGCGGATNTTPPNRILEQSESWFRYHGMDNPSQRIERARLQVGASLMELRVMKERCLRILARAEAAYVELADLLDAAASTDAERGGDFA